MTTVTPYKSVLERAQSILISYPRFIDLHHNIRECQELSLQAGEPQCMSLEGKTGTGKSTLVKSYAALFPRQNLKTGFHIPVFYLETPSPVTVKGMAAHMLEKLGDPAAHRGQLWTMNSRLIKYIHACRIELVILDDFHHLIDAKTDRVLAAVSDWLKVLIKETGVPFMVVGIEGENERILTANAQLSRLFALREQLRPFDWDNHNQESIQQFSNFTRSAEEIIGLSLPKSMFRIDLLYRLYYATDGTIGHLMNLLRQTAKLFFDQQLSEVTLELLAAAYERRLACLWPNKVNPFLSSADEIFVLPSPAPPTSTPQAKSRSKVSANSVLRTR